MKVPGKPRHGYPYQHRWPQTLTHARRRDFDSCLSGLSAEKAEETLRVVDHWERWGVFLPEDCDWIRWRVRAAARFAQFEGRVVH